MVCISSHKGLLLLMLLLLMLLTTTCIVAGEGGRGNSIAPLMGGAHIHVAPMGEDGSCSWGWGCTWAVVVVVVVVGHSRSWPLLLHLQSPGTGCCSNRAGVAGSVAAGVAGSAAADVAIVGSVAVAVAGEAGKSTGCCGGCGKSVKSWVVPLQSRGSH